MKNVFSLGLEDLGEVIGDRPYRAKQVFNWVYHKKVYDFNLMTNLSKILRDELSNKLYFRHLTLEQHLIAKDGTEKFLWRLQDGKAIESVLIHDEERHTFCISSQVGCKMGCKFCCTATMGFIRDLTVDEIVGQLLGIKDMNKEVTNIVFMGMGEPLDNVDNVLKAISIFLYSFGLAISHRRITVSTCGVASVIKDLGKQTDVNLAISLNSANNTVRSSIMPINKVFDLNTLLSALKSYEIKKRKRVTFEYVVLRGINDSINSAKEVLEYLKSYSMAVKVNLISFNPFEGASFQEPIYEDILEFQKYLIDRGIHTIIRKGKGKDIKSACGQLYVTTKK